MSFVMTLERLNQEISSNLVKSKLQQEHLRLEEDDKVQSESVIVTRNIFEKEKSLKCFRCYEPGNFSKKTVLKIVLF